MTGGVNCGGGHRTRLREQLMCLWGAPAPVYKGGEEEAGGQGGCAIGRVQLGFLILVGVSFLFQEGERGKEKEREKERGGRRFLPSPIRTGHGGASGLPCGPPLLSTKAHEGP